MKVSSNIRKIIAGVTSLGLALVFAVLPAVTSDSYELKQANALECWNNLLPSSVYNNYCSQVAHAETSADGKSYWQRGPWVGPFKTSTSPACYLYYGVLYHS